MQTCLFNYIYKFQIRKQKFKNTKNQPIFKFTFVSWDFYVSNFNWGSPILNSN